MAWNATPSRKIAMAKLIGDGDDRCAHRPVFVGALCPGELLRRINPERESHCAVPNVIVAKTRRA